MPDLSQFSGLAKTFDEGIPIKIKHPATGEPVGITITVVAYQGERVKKLQRRMADIAMREAKRNPKKVTTVAEVEDKALDLQVASVLSWEGVEKDGQPLACTPENVRAVLSNPDLWFIGQQLDKAADDEQLFLTASR